MTFKKILSLGFYVRAVLLVEIITRYVYLDHVDVTSISSLSICESVGYTLTLFQHHYKRCLSIII